MKKSLVTGGAGFVGRNLIHSLLKMGHEVHCVDSLVPLSGAVDPRSGWPLFNPFDWKNFHFYPEDCRDYFGRVKDKDFDYAFHLAAIVGGRQVIESQPLAVAEDLAIDSSYWQWALQTQPKKTICFSSSAVYPIEFQKHDHYLLLKEDMIQWSSKVSLPDMSYGWSKLTHEYLAHLAYEKHGLRSVIYRPFSGYGEDQDDHYPFPSICKRALSNQNRPHLTVWGSGNQMRDFIHIEDCISGILNTMDRIENGDALNLSTGCFTSFKQFALLAAEVCGYQAIVRGQSEQPEGVFARAGDTQKQSDFGICAKIPLLEGIQRAIQFYLSSET